MDVPLHVCEARDPKGLYKLARAGKIKGIFCKSNRNLKVWILDDMLDCISFLIWNLFQSWIFIFRLLLHFFSSCALRVLVLSLNLTAYNCNLQVLQGSMILMSHH